MKGLNLYTGIGGNRKLWKDVEVTAVEMNPDIAKIYQDFFPEDTVIVGDAHAYLLEHYKEFDFIWASPPCPTHSRMNTMQVPQGMNPRYPDMKLYQEVLLLKHWFKGKWCVENVVSYYKPLIKPTEIASHYFWSNFFIGFLPKTRRFILRNELEERKKILDFDLSKYNLKNTFEKTILCNCTESEVGLHILNESKRDIQPDLFRRISNG